MKTAEYWKAHLSMPVRYDAAVQDSKKDKDSIFIEIGLGDMLTSITRKTKNGGKWNTAFAFFDSPTWTISTAACFRCSATCGSQESR